MADRDRHIRDSGLPLNDDSIVTIRGGDSSSDSDSEENPNIPFNTPAPSPPPIMPDNQDHVRPQQIANIPLFDGERGEGFVNWLETLENAKDAYNWPVDSLGGVAKSRGGPKICLLYTSDAADE